MNKVKTWEEIEGDFVRMEAMSCKPNFSKLPKGWITDENQSVKWNRDQVELNNRSYQQAVKELNARKNKARDSVLENIYKKIQDVVGFDISKGSAIKIWQYAYERGHAFGFRDIKIYLDEIIDLVSELLYEQYHRKGV